MTKFLLDANLSPHTRIYLAQEFGFDVIDLLSYDRHALSDELVTALAVKERRVVITFDLDFGPIYRRRTSPDLGIILLRLEDQTVEAVNRALGRFFQDDASNIALDAALVVVDETRVRVVQVRT